jgi:hypothetical protein
MTEIRGGVRIVQLAKDKGNLVAQAQAEQNRWRSVTQYGGGGYR